MGFISPVSLAKSICIVAFSWEKVAVPAQQAIEVSMAIFNKVNRFMMVIASVIACKFRGNGSGTILKRPELQVSSSKFQVAGFEDTLYLPLVTPQSVTGPATCNSY